MKNLFKFGFVYLFFTIIALVLYFATPSKYSTTSIFQMYVPNPIHLGSMQDFAKIDSTNRMQFKDIEALVKLYFSQHKKARVKRLDFLPSATNLLFQIRVFSPSTEINRSELKELHTYLGKILIHKNSDLITLLESYRFGLESRLENNDKLTTRLNTSNSSEALVEFEKLNSRLSFDKLTVDSILSNLTEKNLQQLGQHDFEKPESPSLPLIFAICMIIATGLCAIIWKKNSLGQA